MGIRHLLINVSCENVGKFVAIKILGEVLLNKCSKFFVCEAKLSLKGLIMANCAFPG